MKLQGKLEDILILQFFLTKSLHFLHFFYYSEAACESANVTTTSSTTTTAKTTTRQHTSTTTPRSIFLIILINLHFLGKLNIHAMHEVNGNISTA